MVKNIVLFSAVVICGTVSATALPQQFTGRKLLQDPEGFSASSLTPYLKYVDAKCGDPAKVTGNCLELKNKLCGTRDTSEVLCTNGSDAVAKIRSASRYTRVGYLKCSLTKAVCTTDTEGFGTQSSPATIDPRSLAAWNEYTSKCSNNAYETSGATPSECAALSGAHCSRSDVKCAEKDAVFYDTRDLQAKRAILRGDYNTWLVYFVPQKGPQVGTTSAVKNSAVKPQAQSGASGSMFNASVAATYSSSSVGHQLSSAAHAVNSLIIG